MCILFFFNDTATTEIYTLSLHDALPISLCVSPAHRHSDRLRRARIGSSHPPAEQYQSGRYPAPGHCYAHFPGWPVRTLRHIPASHEHAHGRSARFVFRRTGRAMQARTRRAFPLPTSAGCGTFCPAMNRNFAICWSASILFVAVTNLSAQSARQLTRRVVPPSNNAPPAGRAPAARPGSTPPAAVPATNNTVVPAPPPPADAEKAKQETLRKTIEVQR